MDDEHICLTDKVSLYSFYIAYSGMFGVEVKNQRNNSYSRTIVRDKTSRVTT